MPAGALTVFGMLQLVYGAVMLFGMPGRPEVDLLLRLSQLPLGRAQWYLTNMAAGAWLVRIGLLLAGAP
jgi:hypothetical protein